MEGSKATKPSKTSETKGKKAGGSSVPKPTAPSGSTKATLPSGTSKNKPKTITNADGSKHYFSTVSELPNGGFGFSYQSKGAAKAMEYTESDTDRNEDDESSSGDSAGEGESISSFRRRVAKDRIPLREYVSHFDKSFESRSNDADALFRLAPPSDCADGVTFERLRLLYEATNICYIDSMLLTTLPPKWVQDAKRAQLQEREVIMDAIVSELKEMLDARKKAGLPLQKRK